MSDTWFQGLIRSYHEPGLSRALLLLDPHISRLVGAGKHAFEISHEFKDELRTAANMVSEAGRRWAQSFFPDKDDSKLAGYFDWDLDTDIDKIVKTTREHPSNEINSAVHEALSTGKHPQDVVGKLLRTYQVDRAKDIARTVMLNIYAKGSLREMARHGYTYAIRLEVDDRKVCPTCKSLNGMHYKVAGLIDMSDPLTHDTHPRCRGTFIPVINASLVKPDAKGAQYTTTFTTDSGKTIKDVPNEFAMFLRRCLRGQGIPFHVVFDTRLPVDCEVGKDTVRINPKTLMDQDPRELVMEAWATKLWDKYQDRFENEYMLLAKMGLIHPSKTVKTPKDLWIAEFVSYKLNQLDQPWEILWFKTTVKEN